MRKEIEKLLQSVQKPARYAGGELNSVMKDKSKVALRYAFCFPDTYEIGMSHLGMKILYGVANAREDTWCERVFAPADDMEALMRANVKVGDAELRALAQQRAQAVREWLAGEGAVPGERIFVLEPKVEAVAEGGQVQFSLR